MRSHSKTFDTQGQADDYLAWAAEFYRHGYGFYGGNVHPQDDGTFKVTFATGSTCD